MLLINAGVGFWQEFKADNAIALLKQRLALRARVRRDGGGRTSTARLLVPGDVVHVKLGNVVPADLRLAQGDYLSVDQSALTGESLPVDKKAGDDVYSGSIAKQGEMTGVVTATGMNTYFGKTAGLVQKAQPTSHFQRAVLRIGNFLILVTVGLVLVIGLAALFRHDPLIETVQFALILTVASIPVALPAVLVGDHGRRRRAPGADEGDRLAPGRDRGDGRHGPALQRQDRHADEEQADARRARCPPPAADVDELMLAAALASQRDAPDAIDAAILARAPAENVLSQLQDPRLQAVRPGRQARRSRNRGTPASASASPRARRRSSSTFARRRTSCAARSLPPSMRRPPRATARWRWRERKATAMALSRPAAAVRPAARRLRRHHRGDAGMGVDIKMVTGDHEAIARETCDKLNLGTNIVVASDLFDDDGKTPSDRAADGSERLRPGLSRAQVQDRRGLPGRPATSSA